MSADLIKYTEAAMALLEGKIAEIVYLPPDVRKNKTRLKANGVVTDAPPSAKEILDRINAADPLGFLLAIMNGQPVTTFTAIDKKVDVDRDKVSARAKKIMPPGLKLGVIDGYEIRAIVHVPTIDDRKEVAKFLLPWIATKITKAEQKKGPLGDSGDGTDPLEEEREFEELARKRAQGVGGGPSDS